MSDLREWQQLPLTVDFANRMKIRLEELKQEAVSIAGLTIEQFGITAIEVGTEARLLSEIIELLTKEEDDHE
jgi:hypothetical protein